MADAKGDLYWQAKQIAQMGLFAAVGIILSFIELPIMPGVSFLKYDASAVVSVLTGFAFGPAAGCLVGIVVAAMHGLFSSNLVGALMNIGVMAFFVLPPTLLYKYKPGSLSTILGLVMGAILAILAALVLNILITPYYMGTPVEAIIAMIPTILLPFNIIKMTLNAVISFALLVALRKPLKL